MSDYGVAPLDLRLTEKLCRHLAETRYEDFPETTRHQVRRALLDWIGCAVAAAQSKTIKQLITVLAASGEGGAASVIGSDKKLSLLSAPIANGQMGHLLDFDDTHLDGVILHASSPLFSALFALSQTRPVTGRDVATAFITGFEAAVRTGKSAPSHHDGGWHLTGTLGTIGAGAACGRLLGLEPERLVSCLGVAATQAAGLQQNRGTHCKSLHAGKAGSNGVLAALLAEAGFDSSTEILEGRKGFSRVFSVTTDEGALLRDIGARWEIDSNGYKPYACGVVQHPLIDAMIALSSEACAPVDAIEHVNLRVHPHAVKITGVEDPESGLKSKFSLKHSAAIGYLDRGAGAEQYTDARARAADAIAMRAKLRVETVESFRKEEAHATLILLNGDRYEHHVPFASGTKENPLTDAQIEQKFRANVSAQFGSGWADQFVARVWRLEDIDDFGALVRMTASN